MEGTVTDISWDRLVLLEPRLALLVAEARRYGRQSQGSVRLFHRHVKPPMMKLVGWFAESDNPMLKSQLAYNVVYTRLLNEYFAAHREADDDGIAWCERLGRKFDKKRSKSGGRYATSRR
ncbi:hypothetical protein [Solidesulfovibrio alcoholivorans]|uniref:hypothetical protein n=1 Tax=Solidesulfovibrio alcoholivorans TaxID=81406 RepID=UPI000497471B|nr:hypothetical protein [Solidesulfovibrio alcoholivorans]